MPLIKPSPTPDFLVDVVTTTLFAARPTTDVDADTKSSLPVPAIAGGVVAGVILAVAVTLLWICWGKAIKKTREKQQQDKEKHQKTRVNTIRNARISGPKQHSHRPLLKRLQDEKRVKFVGDGTAVPPLPPNSSDVIDSERAKHMLFDNPTTPLPRPAWTLEQRLRRTGSVIWPKPLKKLSQNSIQAQANGEAGEGSAAQPQGFHDEDKAIPHKPSNISATSQFSEASGESRQGRVPTNLILAALGSKNSLNAGDRQSTSSLWSYLFRALPGGRGSHHSAENVYQPPEDQAGYPVGTAL